MQRAEINRLSTPALARRVRAHRDAAAGADPAMKHAHLEAARELEDVYKSRTGLGVSPTDGTARTPVKRRPAASPTTGRPHPAVQPGSSPDMSTPGRQIASDPTVAAGAAVALRDLADWYDQQATAEPNAQIAVQFTRRAREARAMADAIESMDPPRAAVRPRVPAGAVKITRAASSTPASRLARPAGRTAVMADIGKGEVDRIVRAAVANALTPVRERIARQTAEIRKIQAGMPYPGGAPARGTRR
jgi:hypothetical protein